MKHEGSYNSKGNEHPGCGRGTLVDEEHETASKLEDNSNNRGQCGHPGHSPGSETHSDVLTGTGKVHEEPGATDYKEQSEKHSGEMSLCHAATNIAHHKYDVKKLCSSPVYQKKERFFEDVKLYFGRVRSYGTLKKHNFYKHRYEQDNGAFWNFGSGSRSGDLEVDGRD